MLILNVFQRRRLKMYGQIVSSLKFSAFDVKHMFRSIMPKSGSHRINYISWYFYFNPKNSIFQNKRWLCASSKTGSLKHFAFIHCCTVNNINQSGDVFINHRVICSTPIHLIIYILETRRWIFFPSWLNRAKICYFSNWVRNENKTVQIFRKPHFFGNQTECVEDWKMTNGHTKCTHINCMKSLDGK